VSASLCLFQVCLFQSGFFPSRRRFAQSADDLKAVEKNLKTFPGGKDRLEKEGDILARDLRTAQQDKIALAKDIQDQEYSILVLENRIADLEAQ